MATVEQEVKQLNAQRLRAWEAGKEILNRAIGERRDLTREESAAFDRTGDEMVRIDNQRDELLASTRAKEEFETVNEELRRVSTPYERADADRRNSQVESFFRKGGPQEITIDLDHARNVVEAHRAGARGQELRVLAGDSVASSGGSLLVPTVISTEIYSYMTAQTAMRRMNTTKIVRNNGDPFVIPRVGTHAIGTQIATQNTSYTGTDTVFAATTLNFYDAGDLIDVANNLIEDASIDMLALVGQQIGGAIGRYTGRWYVTGNGTTEPQGVMTAIVGAGTVSTGGSLIDPTVETMIDLEYSVVDSYRQNASWLMADSAAKVLRKIRSDAGGTTGQFLWSPSATRGLIDGTPDTFMGYPAFTDVNVSALASNSKSVAFGDFRSYYIADVQGLRLERSTDLRFDKAQTSFRGQLRTAGALLDTLAVNCIKRSV